MINALFEQFVEASPPSVMMRALMEQIFAPDKLDALFEQTAERQYTRELLFSSVVGLMSLVVSGIHPVEDVQGTFRGMMIALPPRFGSPLLRCRSPPLPNL